MTPNLMDAARHSAVHRCPLSGSTVGEHILPKSSHFCFQSRVCTVVTQIKVVPKLSLSCYAGFGTSVVLSGAMGARFIRTGKVMPAGVLMGAGVAGALYNWGKYREWTG